MKRSKLRLLINIRPNTYNEFGELERASSPPLIFNSSPDVTSSPEPDRNCNSVCGSCSKPLAKVFDWYSLEVNIESSYQVKCKIYYCNMVCFWNGTHVGSPRKFPSPRNTIPRIDSSHVGYSTENNVQSSARMTTEYERMY